MNTLLIEQTKALLEEEDLLAALCNVTALLFEETPDINWLGFYFFKNNELVLGPFQGRVACTHLKLKRGVCAHAFNLKELVIVDDVHTFASHIACDSRTNSELVAPIIYNDVAIGVLDIDSISFSRFNHEDKETFKAIAKLIAYKMQNTTL